MTHICVTNPSISLIGPGGELQNSVRQRWVNWADNILITQLGNDNWVDNILITEVGNDNVAMHDKVTINVENNNSPFWQGIQQLVGTFMDIIFALIARYDVCKHTESMYTKTACKNLTSIIGPWIDILSTSCEISLRWVLQNQTDEKSTLLQAMAWNCPTIIHYLNQSWPQSMLPSPGHKEYRYLCMARCIQIFLAA